MITTINASHTDRSAMDYGYTFAHAAVGNTIGRILVWGDESGEPFPTWSPEIVSISSGPHNATEEARLAYVEARRILVASLPQLKAGETIRLELGDTYRDVLVPPTIEDYAYGQKFKDVD